ncbi:hypothetical protein NNJEOMEG_02008 [Fundidesulfovibrio magnetotacticus]|uniref:Acyltransferase 3 domain-containing protein n=1 Tax=Fundidesulfovibrio magnetotacticus TaxID=2730080 RepID=A0A6V8LV27_9BACT|nr:acyltransferase family protein [Fundidesulfovibrio magnetotacticus]GFK94168.1 hypothetical protein NNJEOMEG_02008 [Fundidesulfovibrio magnetotacticus]
MTERRASLDWLKALLITFVVVWHARPWLLDAQAPFLARACFGFFYFHATTLAVPTFLLVSLYLYFQGREAKPGYFGRRMARLLQLYLFWTLTQWLTSWAFTGELAPLTFSHVLQGGPSLPYVGGSVFYFLSDLLVLTVLAEGYARLGPAWRARAGWAVAGFATGFVGLEQAYGIPSYIGLEFFVLYVPAAFHAKELARHGRAFALAWFAFACLESWLIAVHGLEVRTYCRYSNICGALALMGYALSLDLPRRGAVETLSRLSLGVFAVHKIPQSLAHMALAALATPQAALAPSNPQLLALFACTVLGTGVMLWAMDRSPLRRFIR